MVVKLLIRIGLINRYWDQKLKEHGAYERRFDRPYQTIAHKRLSDAFLDKSGLRAPG
jgi:hypothetical protein